MPRLCCEKMPPLLMPAFTRTATLRLCCNERPPAFTPAFTRTTRRLCCVATPPALMPVETLITFRIAPPFVEIRARDVYHDLAKATSAGPGEPGDVSFAGARRRVASAEQRAKRR